MIGYYIHHQGEGHAQRAATIAARTSQSVVGLSSRARPAQWSGEWLQLPRDDDSVPDTPTGLGELDPTANGQLHWAPYATAGVTARMAAISAWIAATEPALIVVDVSVEIAVFARLHGIPVIAVAMPGERNDEPHQLGYGIAEAIIAPWPKAFAPPGWPSRWDHKTYCVGAFSRFDRRPHSPVAPTPDGRRRVVVLGGTGGSYYTSDELAAAQAETPTWCWETLGPGATWVQDPWPQLTGADVIVTHAGQNALADVAAARRPAIVIPSERPHREQEATAAALHEGRFALCRPRWPSATNWVQLLETATALDGNRWKLWASGDGAAKAAAVIDRHAERLGALR